jgi:hypothetical protein
MDANEAASAVAGWAKATCPDLAAYDHSPPRKTSPLPDVAVSVARESVRRNAAELGIAVVEFGLEQADVHVLEVELLLMVSPEPADEATRQLQSFVGQLRESLESDDTLGGRVAAASRYFSATYEPPYIEWDDGTKARCAFVTVTLAELAAVSI